MGPDTTTSDDELISIAFTESDWISIIEGEFTDLQGFNENVRKTITERLCRDGHDPIILSGPHWISKECRRRCGEFYWRLDEMLVSPPNKFRYMPKTFEWEYYKTLEDIPYPEVREAYEQKSRRCSDRAGS